MKLKEHIKVIQLVHTQTQKDKISQWDIQAIRLDTLDIPQQVTLDITRLLEAHTLQLNVHNSLLIYLQA